MKKPTPVLDRDWLPDGSYGNQNTRIAVDMLADAIVQLDRDARLDGDSLQAQLARQTEHVIQLRALVGALAELLVERQVLYGDELQRRVDAKRAELLPSPEPAPLAHGVGGGPYRGGPAAPGEPEPMETCLRCSARVPASDTHITESGVVCDRCWHAPAFE